MSKIDELIREYCPKGVEYKTLEELGSLYGGMTGKSKDDFKDGNARFITYMNVFSNIAVDTSRNDFVKIKSDERQRKLVKGDVLFTGSSENPDECGMSSVVLEEPTEPLYLNSFCFIFRLNDTDLFMPDFLKYLFRDTGIRKQISKTASGVTRFNVSKKRFSKVVIPIPPLAVQKEIASILDKFTQLEAELSAELSARRKQYDYYRNQLLTFGSDSEVQWSTLGEIAIKISSGGTPKTSVSSYYGGEIPWLRTQEVDFKEIWDTGVKISESGLKNSSAKLIPKDCVIIAMYGATVGKSAINKIPLSTNQACANIQVNTEIADYKYVFHWVNHNYKNIKALGTGSQTNINAQTVRNFKIPVPPISEQKRIVSILDKFDDLVNDISAGLPAEINARRKQYEYYRAKLLAFQELPA